MCFKIELKFLDKLKHEKKAIDVHVYKSGCLWFKDPLLFGGSMRRNLDPLTRYPDAHLWKALSEVHLKDKVEKLPGKMYAELSEFGSVFGLGARQLMCLARAMLCNSKVIIVEEAASILDKRYVSLL